MLIQLVLAIVMVVMTVTVHLLGLAGLVRLLRARHGLVRRVRKSALTLLLAASLGLFALHTLEIWLHAAVYLLVGAAANFEEALYFSTVTYTTLGYGDVVLAQTWRIFGAIEGATGLMMIGWSTAFLVSILAQLQLLTHDWLKRDM
jgi:voltage-gated potassium channel